MLRRPALALVLLLAAAALLAACGDDGGGQGGQATSTLPSRGSARAAVDAFSAQVPCEERPEPALYIAGAREVVQCRVEGFESRYLDVFWWGGDVPAGAIAEYARSAVCQGLDQFAYARGGDWSAHPSVRVGAGGATQDRALAERVAAAAGGEVVAVDCG